LFASQRARPCLTGIRRRWSSSDDDVSRILRSMEESPEFVEVAGLPLWTITSGSGVPLLLAHGGPGLWDNLGPVAEMLDDLATVHRYDQRGSPRSPAKPPHRIERLLADVEALRVHWRHTRWLVGGHSWGSFLALLYGLRYSERVQALVLLNGFGITARDREEYHQERGRRLAALGQQRLEQLAQQVADRKPGWESACREFCRLVWPTDFADRARGLAYTEAMLASGFVPNPDVNEAVGLELLDTWPSCEDRLVDLTVPVLSSPV